MVRLTLALLLLFPGSALGAAWTQPAGGGYAKLWLHWLPGLNYHAGPESPTPGIQSIGLYQELGMGTYAELGVTDWFTVTAQWMPVRGFLLGDPRSGSVAPFTTVGDPEVGLRLRVGRHRALTSSVEVGLAAPVGDGRVVADVISSAEGNPRVGGLVVSPGVWGARAQFALGLGLPRIYVEATGGVLVRSGGFRPSIVWSAQAGTTLGKRRLTSGRLRLAAQHPLPLGDAPWGESPSGLGNGTKFFGLTVELERTVAPGWALGASFATSLGLAARQAHGPAITLFVAHQWGG